jgi:hypothetical protein
MAITDNQFTADEFKAAVTTNRDALIPVIKSVLSSDFKFVVQDETEHNTFRTNLESEVVGRKTSEWAQNLEKDVKELTGIDKRDANEKYYDYFKRATTEKLSKLQQVEAELADLRAKGNPSAADKARIQQLEQGLQQKEAEHKAELTAREKRIHELTVGNVLTGELAQLRAKYKKDIPEGIIKTVEQVAINNLLSMAQLQEGGKIVFLDDKGAPLVDAATLLPKSATTLLTEQLKDLIDTGRQQNGAGSGPNNNGNGQHNNNGNNGAPVFPGLPADVKSQIQLTEYLLKLGFLQGTPEFNKLFMENGKNLPLR